MSRAATNAFFTSSMRYTKGSLLVLNPVSTEFVARHVTLQASIHKVLRGVVFTKSVCGVSVQSKRKMVASLSVYQWNRGGRKHKTFCFCFTFFFIQLSQTPSFLLVLDRLKCNGKHNVRASLNLTCFLIYSTEHFHHLNKKSDFPNVASYWLISSKRGDMIGSLLLIAQVVLNVLFCVIITERVLLTILGSL